MGSRPEELSRLTADAGFGDGPAYPNGVSNDPGCCGGGIADTCSQGTVSSVNWKLVGDGRGTHQKVQFHNYVGEGQGSWERAVLTKNEDSCMRKCCTYLLFISLVLIILAGTLWLLLEPPKVGFPHSGNGQSQVIHVGTPPSASLSSSSLAYDCEEGWSDLGASWSQKRRAFCCKEFGRACSKTISISYDCQAGRANSVNDWASVKRDWCCRHHKVGCQTGNQACDTMCTAKGHTASCATRIQWGADHKFLGQEKSCSKSAARVRSNCPICSACALADAQCQEQSTPYDCQAGLSNWAAGWSSEKKSWCCQHEKLGCSTEPVAPTPAVQDLGCATKCAKDGHVHDKTCSAMIQNFASTKFSKNPDGCSLALGLTLQHCSSCNVCALKDAGCKSPVQTTSPFDCSAGFQNWAEGWSIPKKNWCCTHEGKACR